MQKLREENRKLLDEIRKLNQLREQDQKLITSYLEELKQLARPSLRPAKGRP